MSGLFDQAQDREQLERDLAINCVQKSMQHGRDVCACGEAITPLRKSLGAQHCLDCLREIEAEHAKARRRTCL